MVICGYYVAIMWLLYVIMLLIVIICYYWLMWMLHEDIYNEVLWLINADNRY